MIITIDVLGADEDVVIKDDKKRPELETVDERQQKELQLQLVIVPIKNRERQ